jgi:hypothetical protein
MHRLKRSPKVLEYWRNISQGPPFYRQGRVVRYLLSEVMAWGATHRVATGTPQPETATTENRAPQTECSPRLER